LSVLKKSAVPEKDARKRSQYFQPPKLCSSSK
jgi:hypothetical protein